ncbi:MAG TPA: hypothetical protein VNY33_05285 [Gaiellaceae bacterium]|jgi:hypothetical protein|nr:hypothetical protein [Gaiellaceae bacterium]
MAVHREEGSFIVRIELSAEFGEAYEGDDDGNAWLQRWRARVQPRLARAIFEQLRAEPGFTAVPSSRGKNPEVELEISVRFEPAGGAHASRGD